MAQETIVQAGTPLKIVSSEKFNLNLRDFAKGAVIAIITAVLTGVYKAIDTGVFNFDWPTFKPIVISALGAFVAYILKNFFTGAKVVAIESA